MRLRVRDIGEVVKQLAFDEPTEPLNLILRQGPVHDYEFTGPASVTVCYYRAGQDLFLSGRADGEAVGTCARCLESFRLHVEVPFSYVLVPHIAPKVRLEVEDLNLSYYEGEEIDLSPLVYEQLLLSFPTRPLCRQDCRGLCPMCGANRNLEECHCSAPADPRLAVLGRLRAGR